MSTINYYRKNQMGLLPSEKLISAIYEISSRIVHRGSSLLPQTAQTAYFRVSGKVIITHIIGEVTVELGAVATNLDLWSNPTVGTDVALCTTVAVASKAVGTMFTITGTLANAMIATTSGAVAEQAAGILVAAGTIDLKASANNTGQTKWVVRYKPVDEGATIIAI